MSELARAFWNDEGGVTSIEYGLIASMISIVSTTVFRKVGSNLVHTFGDIANNLSSV